MKTSWRQGPQRALTASAVLFAGRFGGDPDPFPPAAAPGSTGRELRIPAPAFTALLMLCQGETSLFMETQGLDIAKRQGK